MAATRNQFLPLRFRVAASRSPRTSVILATVLTIAVIFTAVIGQAPSAQALSCAPPLRSCTSGSISNGSVAIGGSQTKGGSPASAGSVRVVTPIIVVPAPTYSPEVMAVVCSVMAVRPWYCPAPIKVVTPAKPAVSPVTLSDIARFVPQTPTLITEPNGWGLVNQPVNFLAPVVTHTVSGTLLGSPATVRFTPVSFRWTFGDAQSRTTTSSGLTWHQLGQESFTATPTSHTYLSIRHFVASVTVTYAAAYRFDASAWVAISGSLTRSDTAPMDVVAGGVPVLVTGDCTQFSSSLGC